jgi:hypothetical protein
VSATKITVELEPYEARALARAVELLFTVFDQELAEFHKVVGTHPLEATVMKLQTALVCEQEAL